MESKKPKIDTAEYKSNDPMRSSLVEFFRDSPLRDSGTVLEREQDFGRDLQIE